MNVVYLKTEDEKMYFKTDGTGIESMQFIVTHYEISPKTTEKKQMHISTKRKKERMSTKT